MPEVLILGNQRSGTHFLQSSLASHPNIHGRGECFLRYRRLIAEHPSEQPLIDPKPFTFTNRPDHINIAILMYNQVNFAIKEFGLSLNNFKIIHLLRDPHQVAYSIAQMKADRKSLGAKFKAHYRVCETPPPPSPVSLHIIDKYERQVALHQKKYSKKLKSHPNVLTIHYETLTHGRQINEISRECASSLLEFFGLDYFTLKNNLRKTGNIQ